MVCQIKLKLMQLKVFLKTETGEGCFLFFILCCALLVANSPFVHIYRYLITFPIPLHFFQWRVDKPALIWVNEGLMTLFFLGLALEIKQELLVGHLSTIKKSLLPFFGAAGGVLCPLLIYLLCTRHDVLAMKGWPIPTATDVALSLAAVSALGKRVPRVLRVFLMALSIIDDIAAIMIIALLYTTKLAFSSAMFALIGVGVLLLLNFSKVQRLVIYILVGFFIWVCVLKSGVHATLAGVVLGLAIPYGNETHSPLIYLSKKLRPWINYFVLPVFIFWNGGFILGNFSFDSVLAPVSLGIILGLWFGKGVGIFLGSYLSIKLKLAHKPQDVAWLDILGVASLGGIGFTMSLFLSTLAFSFSEYQVFARQGILIGSTLSFLTGLVLFLRHKSTAA